MIPDRTQQLQELQRQVALAQERFDSTSAIAHEQRLNELLAELDELMETIECEKAAAIEVSPPAHTPSHSSNGVAHRDFEPPDEPDLTTAQQWAEMSRKARMKAGGPSDTDLERMLAAGEETGLNWRSRNGRPSSGPTGWEIP